MANIYKNFEAQDVISVKKEVTRGVFTGNASELTSFYTGSQAAATSSIGRGLYHLDVFNTGSTEATAAIQFSLSYGHVSGFGTPTLATDSSSRRPTQAVYNQYANTLLPRAQRKFKFYSGSVADTHESDDVFVINFSRTRIKEKLDEGNFEIHLSGSSGIISLVDDSDDITNPTVGPGGIVYNLGSGSINSTTAGSDIVSYTASNGEGFGKIYPESGIVILNPSAIAAEIGSVPSGELSGSVGNTTVGVYDNLHYNLFESLQLGAYIKARSSEDITSQNFFVRVRNTEFNFSNNPTYVTGSNNQIVSSLYNEPITYITTIGMYNQANELLAVAKPSRPIENGRDSESLIKVKIDF